MTAHDGFDRLPGDPSWTGFAKIASAALAYCLFFLALRNMLSPTIAVDDVEALIAVQSLDWGYRLAQPPLHGWLLWLATEIVGPGLLALSLIKYALLFGTIVLFYAAARRLTCQSLYALLATVSLALIYLIGFKIHRGYTHTAALMFACAATFYLFVLIRDGRTLAAYALLGLAAGLGLLSKYNFVAFLVSLLVAGTVSPTWRPALVTPRAFLSVAVCGLVVLPYLHWIATDASQSLSALIQTRLPDDSDGFLATRAAAVGQVLRAYLEFLLPFMLLVPLFFPVLWRRGGWSGLARTPAIGLLTTQWLAGLAFLLLVVLVTGTSAFKGRHLHPLLMFTPILVFLIVEQKAQANSQPLRVAKRSAGLYLAAALLATLGTATSLGVRAYQPVQDCGKCRLQQPYPALASYLRDNYGIRQGTLIAGDEFIGGNLRAGLPGLRVYALPYLDVTPPADGARPTALCLVVWDGATQDTIPQPLASLAARVRGRADLAEGDVRRVDIAFRHAPDVSRDFRYIILPARGDCY